MQRSRALTALQIKVTFARVCMLSLVVISALALFTASLMTSVEEIERQPTTTHVTLLVSYEDHLHSSQPPKRATGTITAAPTTLAPISDVHHHHHHHQQSASAEPANESLAFDAFSPTSYRRARWTPLRCRSHFASERAFKYVHNLINWSTELAATSPSVSVNSSIRNQSVPPFSACSYWASGMWSDYGPSSSSSSSSSAPNSQQQQPFRFHHYRRIALSQTHRACNRPQVYAKSSGVAKPQATTMMPRYRDNNITNKNGKHRKRDRADDGNKTAYHAADLAADSFCSIGRCFARSFAAVIRGVDDDEEKLPQHENVSDNSNITSDNDKNKKPLRPPLLLFIGDSRARNMFQRFIMMVRSNQAGGANERDRSAVVDNYFHLNATYVVTEKGDEINILPHGTGCDHQRMFPVSKKMNAGRDRIILAVCFIWCYRTLWARRWRDDFHLSELVRSLQPDTVIWMPTLHDCVGHRCDNNSAFAGHVYGYGRVLAQELVQTRSIRNRLLFLTTPMAIWAKSAVIHMRNGALKLAARHVQLKQLRKAVNILSSSGTASSSSSVLLPNGGLPVPFSDHDVKRIDSMFDALRNKGTADAAALSVFGETFDGLDLVDNAARRGVNRKKPVDRGDDDNDSQSSDEKNASPATATSVSAAKKRENIDEHFRHFRFAPRPALSLRSVGVVDLDRWVRAFRPERCDRVHNMCNFRPMIDFGNVTHFRAVCNACVDSADFCFWMHARRGLV